MQVVDFRVSDHPVLLAEFIFHDADVTAVVKRGTYIYVGLSSNATGLESPAMLQEFRQFTSGWNATGLWMQLPSSTVTDLAGTGNSILASVGSRNGGIMHIDKLTMHGVAFAAENDIRSLCFDAAGTLWSTSGGAALSHLTMPSLTVLAPQSDRRLRPRRCQGHGRIGRFLLVLGRRRRWLSGARPRRCADGDPGEQLVLGPRPRPRGDERGVGRRLAGIRRRRCDGHSSRRSRPLGGTVGATTGLRVLGQLGFEDGFSSNMVKARSNIMVVAAGRGGVELVRLTQTP
jgi:hypothetical protein